MSIYTPAFAGILGTLAMTLYTLIAFHLTKSRYYPVRILAQMLRLKSVNTQTTVPMHIYILANMVHYAIGVLFGYSYHWLISKKILVFDLHDTFIFGILIAFIAIIGWQLFFFFHPTPPPVRLKQYLPVIWSGHIILAIVMFYTSQVFTDERITSAPIPMCYLH
jgi:hypothetical protein